MKNQQLQEFSPPPDEPLIVGFSNYVRSFGYSTAVSFDFFDMHVYLDQDESILDVKQIRNDLTADQIRRLVIVPTLTKVVLIEGSRPKLSNILANLVLLSAAGVGAFAANLGWLWLPRRQEEVLTDVRYKLAPRWHQDPDRGWLKACTACGELKTPSEFYNRPQKTALDGKRNFCIPCFKKGAARQLDRLDKS